MKKPRMKIERNETTRDDLLKVISEVGAPLPFPFFKNRVRAKAAKQSHWERRSHITLSPARWTARAKMEKRARMTIIRNGGFFKVVGTIITK